jgi:hypothetical protein
VNRETPLAKLLMTITNSHGFLTAETLKQLAELDRLRMVLVRCGNGRFTCPAQDVTHLVSIIFRDFKAGSDGRDYVRDISLPSGDAAFRGNYAPHTVEGSYRPQSRPIDPPAKSGFPKHSYTREQDYGGAFDGTSVTSDADSGL